ncbi:MAG: phosphatase PAP2 family protein [Microbacterium sp.]|uniref:phosphatase PAP2 family protein n=1 Tax=Microbacterium sp. TaxID=51671 RepID=UPI001AC98C69|nr:phosphatase PAP2 family protein [Microbacterium sp.]MBN9155770.1 phosphatase PAP2 family protein [Microbacterium sp.]
MPTPLRPRPRWRIATAGAAAALTVTLVAGWAIVAAPSWSATEVRIVAAVHGDANGLADVVALTVNSAFGPGGAVLVSLIALTWTVMLRRSWRPAVRMLAVLVIPWGCAEIIKAVVQRPRPDAALLSTLIVAEPRSYSYPSGHTAFAAALACAVVLVLFRPHSRSRAVAVAAGALVVLVTAWSRVYLGVHYPTDVAASMFVVPVVAVAVHRLTAGRAMFDPPDAPIPAEPPAVRIGH